MPELEPITRVIFRKYPVRHGGDVIALMPDLPWSAIGGDCTCYAHVGQHGGASYARVMQDTVRATPDEYAKLLKELSRIGYRVRVIARRR